VKPYNTALNRCDSERGTPGQSTPADGFHGRPAETQKGLTIMVERRGAVTFKGTPMTLVGDEEMVRHLLTSVVENAAEHNTSDRPRVRVTVSVGRDEWTPVSVVVDDNGPGIPEQERSAITRENETPLEHGSGLGRWTAQWGITRLGGDLSFSDNVPRGTIVRLDLPGVQSAPSGRS